MMNFELHGDVGVITLDDGKANAVGYDFIEAMNEGLDAAGSQAKAVLITGREGVFSAGFDLKEIQKGPDAANAMVSKGAEMLLRIFAHPQPVVVAAGGHAIAAGALILLAADTRIGVTGDFKFGLNETAIGMSLPTFGMQLALARISMRHQTQAIIQAQLFGPEDATDIGFLDEVVDPSGLQETALARAAALAELPGSAYANNKQDARASYIKTIRESLA